MTTTRNRVLVLGAAAAAVLLAGAAAPPAPDAGSGAREPAGVVDTGRLPLVSYDAEVVPAGATARVRAAYAEGGGTVVRLRVWGLVPERAYGAHVHASACGATDPAAAGGHFQHAQDPVRPSTDPAYANPRNEIWLDFTTDAEGAATVRSAVRWRFPADRHPGSVVLHDRHTAAGPAGLAGTAGARHGCLDVPFGDAVQAG
ncbi:superoxide dismutase [Streptomyces sp. NPDC089799]|uniref:superoxide dismutase n=1 Tax=Streptomyces sp. NPDC089799 TaxID=3155066 RepID=UPI0034310C22